MSSKWDYVPIGFADTDKSMILRDVDEETQREIQLLLAAKRAGRAVRLVITDD